MTPAGRLRFAGLIERAQRLGLSLTDLTEIPEGLYTPDGIYVEICPYLPPEIDDLDDDAVDAFLDFALDSESIMLDAVELTLATLDPQRLTGAT